MPKIPGTFGSNGGVPPNIEWDPGNPPVKHACSNGDMHARGCDGSCEAAGFMKEHEVLLVNEYREWARIGMGTGQVTGDNPFDIQIKVAALTEFLHEKGLLDIDELNEFFVRFKVDKMSKIRQENQEQVKRARLGLGPSGLIGPNGQPL